jgi:hypothetical protein
MPAEAATLYEGEELYIDRTWPWLLKLLSQPVPDAKLGRHPLIELLGAHGMCDGEDSPY